MSGTWTGSLNSPNKLAVRFVLEDKDGVLSGRAYWEDPDSRAFEPEGEVVGTFVDGGASWKTEGEVKVTGQFEGDSFTGTLTFPAFRDQPAKSVSVTLTR